VRLLKFIRDCFDQAACAISDRRSQVVAFRLGPAFPRILHKNGSMAQPGVLISLGSTFKIINCTFGYLTAEAALNRR
jgi:hypothetical protein